MAWYESDVVLGIIEPRDLFKAREEVYQSVHGMHAIVGEVWVPSLLIIM